MTKATKHPNPAAHIRQPIRKVTIPERVPRSPRMTEAEHRMFVAMRGTTLQQTEAQFTAISLRAMARDYADDEDMSDRMPSVRKLERAAIRFVRELLAELSIEGRGFLPVPDAALTILDSLADSMVIK